MERRFFLAKWRPVPARLKGKILRIVKRRINESGANRPFQYRAEGPGNDLARPGIPAEYLHAFPGHPAIFHDEMPYLPFQPTFPQLKQSQFSEKGMLFFEFNGPTESRSQGINFFTDLMAVERIAGFEAQAVPATQAVQ